ncbi:hypothetical protein C8R46DRAFT_1092870 [Mycena filopes]|nr:hypothetical protein C8R46DRAFT_1092870 [Mycena filopes]
MSTFVTSIRERPDLNTIQPIAKAGTEADLRALLNSNSVGAGYIDRILYFPKRMLWTSDAQLHALAFAPAEHYERDGTGGSWRPATEIADLKGQWRELFVDLDGAIVYAGTYRCHDLRYLCPGGTPAPEHISPLELLHAAGLGEVSPAERARALSGSENGNGVLRVDCVGLQCFGFNGTLYDALKRLTRGMKRDLAEAERPDEGPTKRRHVG